MSESIPRIDTMHRAIKIGCAVSKNTTLSYINLIFYFIQYKFHGTLIIKCGKLFLTIMILIRKIQN